MLWALKRLWLFKKRSPSTFALHMPAFAFVARIALLMDGGALLNLAGFLVMIR